MSTPDHPRLDEIRRLVAAKARIDRRSRWPFLVLMFGLTCMTVRCGVSLVFDGTLFPSDPDGGAFHRTPLSLLTIVGLLGCMAGAMLFLLQSLQVEFLTPRFPDCLDDPTTRAVPPLEGETIGGMRCVEAGPGRMRLESCLNLVWMSPLVVALALMLLSPWNIAAIVRGLRSDSTRVFAIEGIGVGAFSLFLLLICLILVRHMIFLRQVTFTFGCGPVEPCVEVNVGGLRPSRTFTVPVSAMRRIVTGSGQSSLEYENPVTRSIRTIPVVPREIRSTRIGRWQAERLRAFLQREYGLEVDGTPSPRKAG